MANVRIAGKTDSAGTYSGADLPLSSGEASVLYVDAEELTAEYAVTPAVWTGGEDLVYTLTLSNATTGDETYPYLLESVETDAFDALVTLKSGEGSVTVDGADFTDYTFSGQVLTLNFTAPHSIAVGDNAVIQFRMVKAQA